MRKRHGLTRRKLGEAEFFLSFLKPTYQKDKKFDYYLSAFVSAARSVGLAMVAEYKEVPGFELWNSEHKRSDEEERLFKGATKVRNRTQKTGALRTISKVAVSALSVSDSDKSAVESILKRTSSKPVRATVSGTGGKYTVTIFAEGEPLVIEAKKVKLARELEEFPGEDIVSVCEAYFAAIGRMVNECEERFDA